MDKNWSIPKHECIEIEEKKNKYCLCIPVINEGDRIREQLSKINESGLSSLVDIVICDGGSTDGSLDESFLKQCNVSVLLVKRDTGKLSAQLRMGYAYALDRGYEGIITIDGNNKDDVMGIPRFIEAMDKGYNMVQGSRFIKGGQAINTPLVRHLALKIIHAPFISLGAGYKYTDTTNGFRGYTKKLLLDKRVQPFRDVFNTYELLAYLSVRAPRLGYKTTEVPVTRQYPSDGKVPTKISFLKGNWLLMKILFSAVLGRYNPDEKN